MRARSPEISGVHMSRVAVKATTSERLGFTGREEVSPRRERHHRLPWDAKVGVNDMGAATLVPSPGAARSLRMRKLTIATAESCTAAWSPAP